MHIRGWLPDADEVAGMELIKMAAERGFPAARFQHAVTLLRNSRYADAEVYLQGAERNKKYKQEMLKWLEISDTPNEVRAMVSRLLDDKK
ncbi:unnamed protein product [Gongylonema pulchrum]|uniref:Sel1 repeat family protein n=1 Tax=Gongylonema pulchrum TaxID=637853 RepID=A0A183DT93_9BILA|nr:unnamed protein product [Gongylonema pulchrum]